jgi:glycosyltransferase involved in cell wall biosynthesis
MRIILVGTDLAAVRPGAGALESLLSGWARGLTARQHKVTVVSVTAPVPDGPDELRGVHVERPSDLRPLLADLRPDVVILNNRPAWQEHVDAPTLHLFHNWPDAWAVPIGQTPPELIGRAGAAAVSHALAAAVAAALRRPAAAVSVVVPFVDRELFAVPPRPEPGLVLSPNRLMIKKGVQELALIAGHPSMRTRRVLITDYLSPWTTPTAEHLALRAIVEASAAHLIGPPSSRAGMAALYARAEVVVCPSIHPEGLGLTALEAQAAGVPVVSSGLGGLREACLRPDLIADPHDPPSFIAAIDRAAALDAMARDRIRDIIRARYTPAVSLDSLLAAVERTLGGVGASGTAHGASGTAHGASGTAHGGSGTAYGGSATATGTGSGTGSATGTGADGTGTGTGIGQAETRPAAAPPDSTSHPGGPTRRAWNR